MNWFQQNRFLGTFLAILGVVTLGALYFIWSSKSSFDEAKANFDQNAAELNGLRRLSPFPSEVNLKKMKTQADDYGAELNKLKAELKARALPAGPMAPNEFQSRLRQAITQLNEKAKANKVKLPENFFLGFEEFSATLPDTAAAPLLGQQLAQAEMLVGMLIDARVEAITAFKRVAATDPAAAVATPAPGPARKPTMPAGPGLIERTTVEFSILSSPGAARRVLNQIATANQQFFLTRTLHVLNEKNKGPARVDTSAAAAATPTAPAPAASPTPASKVALSFIVGNERLQTTARVEMLRFAF